MTSRERIGVEVVYARSDRQEVLSFDVAGGTTAGEAVDISGLASKYLEIEVERNGVGIFGRRVALDTPLSEGDRVEILRPLLVDPKEARRRRARRRGSPRQ